ncbi:MAG: long-chain fatty acid transporter, partial [Novosphingobium sp.]|nr:long-chain fatty acid transporter [Novosphingobium sp.]
FGWRNITVYKTAAVYKASDRWTLRAGYGRSGNPIPRSQTFLNILAPGVVQDHFTAGATLALLSKVEVTGYVMRAPTVQVKGQGSIPLPFGAGEADIHLAETAAGLSVGIIF